MKRILWIALLLCAVCIGAHAAQGEWIYNETIEVSSGGLLWLSDDALKAIEPDGKTSFYCEDASVASVDRWGNVQAERTDTLRETSIVAQRGGVSYIWKLIVHPLSSAVELSAGGQPLDGQLLDLDAGQTSLLVEARVLPEGAAQQVEFSVSGKGASIDENGLLTFTGDGRFTVTARAADKGRAQAQADVVALHPVHKITLSGQTQLTAGQYMQLEAAIVPENATVRQLVWTSSDENIAAVDKNGVVVGMKISETSAVTITATSADGSGAVCSFPITVVPAAKRIDILLDGEPFPTQSLVLDDSMVGEVLNFSAAVYPADAQQGVKWTSGNNGIIKTDSSGRLGVVGRGTCRLTLETADGLVKRTVDVCVQDIDDHPYYLEVDKGNQVVRVYEKDEKGMYTVLSRRMVCSTGVYDNAFANGLYDVDNARKEWMGTILDGVYCQYGVRFYDMIWFHSLPYQGTNPARMDMGAYAQLGTKASHGCIRLLAADAKWIHDNVPGGSMMTVCKCERVESEYGAVSWPEAQGGWDPTDPNEKNPYFDPEYTSAVPKG